MNCVSKIKPARSPLVKGTVSAFSALCLPISWLVTWIPEAGCGAWGLQVGMTKAKDLGGRGTPGLGWETPEEGGEKPPSGFRGELPGWGGEGRETGHKERKAAGCGRGEREGRANTGSLICSSSAFSVRRMNLMS